MTADDQQHQDPVVAVVVVACSRAHAPAVGRARDISLHASLRARTVSFLHTAAFGARVVMARDSKNAPTDRAARARIVVILVLVLAEDGHTRIRGCLFARSSRRCTPRMARPRALRAKMRTVRQPSRAAHPPRAVPATSPTPTHRRRRARVSLRPRRRRLRARRRRTRDAQSRRRD